MNITFEVDQSSIQQTIMELRTRGDRAMRAGARALRMESEFTMAVAKERTPVDTGTLRATGVVIQVEDFIVALFFGGPAAFYAVEVHENYLAFHHVGGAGFLRTAVEESIPRMPIRIARAVKKELEG